MSAPDGKLYYYIPVSQSGHVPVDLEETKKVFEFGVKKHGGKGFHTGVVKQSDHFYACLRHLWKYFLGFKADDETGYNHLHHAHCRMLMMIYQDQNKVEPRQIELFNSEGTVVPTGIQK